MPAITLNLKVKELGYIHGAGVNADLSDILVFETGSREVYKSMRCGGCGGGNCCGGGGGNCGGGNCGGGGGGNCGYQKRETVLTFEENRDVYEQAKCGQCSQCGSGSCRSCRVEYLELKAKPQKK